MKIIACITSALILLSSQVALGDDLKPFERMDVFELEWISDPQISPDGRRVVYVRNSMDVMTDQKVSRLWLIDVDGSDNEPLTGRDVDELNPVWSHDGRRIAFTSKSDAGSEVFVVWVDDGKSTHAHRYAGTSIYSVVIRTSVNQSIGHALHQSSILLSKNTVDSAHVGKAFS
ncbi:MAG: PD40 domain-containing protein [Chloroflexi bacterium]|nr:PD40 domain-containing protein [Chloroflexota bacterium]